MKSRNLLSPILLDQFPLCAIHHCLDRVLKFVGAGAIFQMTPETFDRVQIRTVGRQPDRHHPMLKQTQRR